MAAWPPVGGGRMVAQAYGKRHHPLSLSGSHAGCDVPSQPWLETVCKIGHHNSAAPMMSWFWAMTHEVTEPISEPATDLVSLIAQVAMFVHDIWTSLLVW